MKRIAGGQREDGYHAYAVTAATISTTFMVLDFQPVWIQEGGRLWSSLQLCSWLSGSNRSPVLEPGSGYSPDPRRPERMPCFCTCFPSSCDIGEKDHQEDLSYKPGHVDKSTFFNETILSRHMLAPFHFLSETDISWNVPLHKIKNTVYL